MSSKTNDPTFDEPLSALEKESLVYTIEEARLTQDINAFLFEKWDMPVFSYVLTQEANHIYKLKRFIKEQGGYNPLKHSIKGKFNMPAMQADYNKYVNVGKNTATSALYVSMTIEEHNYINMQKRIAESENVALLKLYNNRLINIGDHIRVLYKRLRKMDVQYEAQVINQNEFEGILNPDILLEDVSM